MQPYCLRATLYRHRDAASATLLTARMMSRAVTLVGTGSRTLSASCCLSQESIELLQGASGAPHKCRPCWPATSQQVRQHNLLADTAAEVFGGMHSAHARQSRLNTASSGSAHCMLLLAVRLPARNITARPPRSSNDEPLVLTALHCIPAAGDQKYSQGHTQTRRCRLHKTAHCC